jgi:hypothetical protein
MRFPGDSSSEFENKFKVNHFHNPISIKESKLNEKSHLKSSADTSNF